MASWAGFSEEELRRIQKKVFAEPGDAGVASCGRGRRSSATNRSRLQLQREKALQSAAKHSCGSPLSPDQQLSYPPPLPPEPGRPCLVKAPEQDLKALVAPAAEPPSEDPPVVLKELDQKQVELREKTRIEHLQWEQRLMEEKNKRRKALLAKTIAEKSKQTQAEAVKLKKIQKELQALDDSVSNDIGILRRLIEQASLEYSTAWKRLEKAEAEYVAAKLDLHKKTEAKEQLTEHLCAIIQQNELRKACKLDELMQQLELRAEGEGTSESPAPQGARGEGRAAVGADAETPMDSTDVGEDRATTAPKTSRAQEEEFSAAAPSMS
ncbi:RAB6-interacting golgin [Electrophorus electricus]|uniref:RAB6-interacting golgin n=1 Tax=Electrophorus electricus TaxID=8005 RepID=UPI0015D05827|nr:RAB6-interacting golgin [Electrophorus electricus]